MADLSMKPSRDDLAQRQPRRGGGSGGSGSGGSPLLGFLVVIALGAASVGGWYLWQEVERLRAELNSSKTVLQSAEQSVSGLQETLAQQKASLNESGSSTTADIELLKSEVRKLWDLANKRNKADIAAQAKSLEQLKASMQQQSERLTAQLTEGRKQAEQKVTALQRQLADLTEKNATLSGLVDSQRKSLSQLQDLAENAGGFEDRITSLEVAINAIDAHRRQLNERLSALDRDMARLQQQPAPM